MSKLVGIIDYGVAGNIASIEKAVQAAGGQTCIVKNASDLADVGMIVLPGVGSFKGAMQQLEEMELVELLKENIGRKPTLGICLGMQILSRIGFEHGETEGLDFFDAEVRLINCRSKIPHMGFSPINVVKESPLLDGVEEEEFYFMHSYEVANYTDVNALASYAGHTFVAAISNEHTFGVQFHPEKSRQAGIQVFKNFIELGGRL